VKRYICFNANGNSYGVATDDLAGVSELSPMASYPGLPSGVSEIAYWKGKLYVVPESDFFSPQAGGAVYLFTHRSAPAYALDLAFKISGNISVKRNDGSFTVLSLDDLQRLRQRGQRAA